MESEIYTDACDMENSVIRLSFILPVYNVEKYIARCLDSIYALPIGIEQFEVICIDDCSTDNSIAVIKEYQLRYANLHLLHHKSNARQGAARNTGIRYAKGVYCMFVDADDTLPQFDVIKLMMYMQKNDIELLLGKANVIANNGNISIWGHPPAHESAILRGPEIFINEDIHRIAFGVVWFAIYKMELVRRTRPFLENVQYEDTDWTLPCAYTARRLQYMPIILYNYHINSDTTTTTKSLQSLIERTKQSLRIYEWGLSTSDLHNEIMIAVEDYGTWNLRGLSGIIKYSFKERRIFYTSFSKSEFRTIAKWKGGNYTKLLVRFPIASQIVLILLRPIYVLCKLLKNFIRKQS